MNSHEENSVRVLVEESRGQARRNEPVTFGIPFPAGKVADCRSLTLWDASGRQCPLQVKTLNQWCDGSAKWVLFDFQADVEANAEAVYQLRFSSAPCTDFRSMGVSVNEETGQLIVDTGPTTFFLNRRTCKPFDRVVAGGHDLLISEGSSFRLMDESRHEYLPYIRDLLVEAAGPLRATIRVVGELVGSSQKPLASFAVRLSFYAGRAFVEIQATLHNPRAARHYGGLWDLGDEGSIYFKDFSLHVPLRIQAARRTAWTAKILQGLNNSNADALEIYQDSSGGKNWQSTNHVNRFGKVMQSFPGYRVTTEGSVVEEGLRATPTIAICAENGGITGTIEKFWQNFPKALEARDNELILRLFPQQYGDVFELQGGEQKTHAVYLGFSGQGKEPADLAWTHERLVPRASPEWYSNVKACLYLSPLSQDPDLECRELIDSGVTGPQSFFARREVIDEYGWRHFGDLYADHEAVGHTGETPLVAHYNNQYDVIYGAILQYLRSGDRRWFELMHDLARHVIDIDIYHTQKDRPAYNGGLFWHTDHYYDAGTATHRAYSKANLKLRGSGSYGGGPSNEHNYTTGLLHYYYLTGDEMARQAVLSLADWVLNMDDGSQRLFGMIDLRPTGLASSTNTREYHGPGRGAGNSINALLDAHTLTHDGRYLAKAEQIVRRCIHPRDNIEKYNLDDPEHQWSYLVLLQILGKYLDAKTATGEIDYMYSYAQASLLHYAEWMLQNEVPYATVLDKVKIPTETWPAQDIRKCVVFHLAAKHAIEPLRSRFQEKAEFFFQTCVTDLRSFTTCMLTRPVVVLLTNAYIHSYFKMYPEETAPQSSEQYDFGKPRRFSAQFAELYWSREKLTAGIHTLVSCGQALLSLFKA